MNINKFSSINNDNEYFDSRKSSGKSFENLKLFGSLQTSTSHSLLLNYKQIAKSPRNTRTFKQFYNEQMAHIQKKTNKIQNSLFKKERIYEEMERQRNRIKHLSEESRRILSNSRERKSERGKRNDLNFSRNNQSNLSLKSSAKNLSQSSVYERLYSQNRVSSRERFIRKSKISNLSNLIGCASRSNSRKRRMFENKVKM